MAQRLRERIDQWDYKKLKSFCTTKEIISKFKRVLPEWEYIWEYNRGSELAQNTLYTNMEFSYEIFLYY
jgi:hypothetical protein